MKYVTFLVLVIFISCKNDTSTNENEIVESVVNPTVKDLESNRAFEVYDYDGLEPLINKTDDKIHVVNFWATWCAPCVKELPYFEAINEKYKAEGVEVLLVSLDFPNKYDSNLKPFIKEHKLKSKVVALDDTNMNRWLPLVNKDWTGAIPATIIYNNENRQFYEQSFTQEELEIEISGFLQ